MCLCGVQPRPPSTPQLNKANQATVKEKINTDLCFCRDSSLCIYLSLTVNSEQRSTAARPADSPSVSQRRAALPEPAAATAATALILAQITQASRKCLVVNVAHSTLSPNSAFLYVPHASFSGAGVVLLRFSMSGSRSGHQTAEMGAVTLLSGLGNPTLRLRHYATDSNVFGAKSRFRFILRIARL